MNTHYLTSLFTPNKIALFGASDRENSVGGVVFRNLLSAGFEGQIFAINPKHDTVQGKRHSLPWLKSVSRLTWQ